ncbi:unnamed protein product [Eretmochelys imbricata]
MPLEQLLPILSLYLEDLFGDGHGVQPAEEPASEQAPEQEPDPGSGMRTSPNGRLSIPHRYSVGKHYCQCTEGPFPPGKRSRVIWSSCSFIAGLVHTAPPLDSDTDLGSPLT